MSNRTKSRLRYVTTIALSYLLSIFLLLLIVGLVLLQTAFNPSFMLRQIENVGFTEEMYQEIREIFISYASASGIPHDVMLEGLSQRQVDNAITANVYAAFSAASPYDYARHENELFEIFLAFALEQGSTPSEELDEGLRDLAVLSMEAFTERTDLGLFVLLAEFASRIHRVLNITISVAAALIVLTAVMMPLINRRVTRWIDGYIYALGAVALFCIAIPIFALGTGWTGRLNITPMSFNRLISAWLEGIIGSFSIALIPVLSFIAICVIIRINRRNRRRRRYKG
jgi:hypothetical protein